MSETYIATPFATGFLNAYGVGPVGLTFDAQGALLAGDYWQGQIYRFSQAGGVAGPSTLLGPPGPNGDWHTAGLAYTPDGRLYMARQNANDIVEVDPATGTVLRTVASLQFATGLATDPLSGDLFVTRGYPGLFRISHFSTGPGTLTLVDTNIGGLDGISFAPDGSLFVARYGNALLSTDFRDAPNDSSM